MTDTIPEDGGRPYWLPDWLYQILKWVGLAFLPRLVPSSTASDRYGACPTRTLS